MQRNSEKIGQQQAHCNRGDDGYIHGEFHISCRPKSIAERAGERKRDGVENIVDEHQPNHKLFSLRLQRIQAQKGRSKQEGQKIPRGGDKKRYQRQLLQELGREPSPEETAEVMGIPVERVREIHKISQEPVSLETPIGEEEDSHLGDFIQDENVPVPAEAAAFTLLKEQLVEVLGTLTEREQKVLRLRFGLDDGRARTLEEVGKEFNVTRERIRQIEAKALRKLRHPSRSRKLRDYLEENS